MGEQPPDPPYYKNHLPNTQFCVLKNKNVIKESLMCGLQKNVPTPWGVPLEIMGMMEVYKRKKNYFLIQTLYKIFMQSNIS